MTVRDTGSSEPAREAPSRALRAPLPRRLTLSARIGSLARSAESSLLVRCLLRFRAIGGRDRVLVLAGEAFTTVVPLAIVVAAATSRDGRSPLADTVVTRFRLSGEGAEAARTLFSRPPDATSTITLAGIVVLLASLLSLTRSLQRTYEEAWGLPAHGVRGTLYGFGGMGLLIAEVLVLGALAGALRHVPAGSALTMVLRILGAAALWLVLQSLLLARRVPIRQLVPGALVAGAGQAILGIFSAVFMPRLISSNAGQYGIIGVTFALLSWLIVIAGCLVAVAVISAEAGQPADT